MSTPTPASYGQPPLPPQPPAAQQKGRRRWLIPTVTGVAGLVLGTGIGGAGGSGNATTTAAPGSTTTATVTQTSTVTAPAAQPATSTTDAAPADYTPNPKDFKLTAKVLNKQCFGSAGCNVTYRVQVAKYTGQPLPDDTTFEVTYQVAGPDDGTQVGTFTVTGGKAEMDSETMASTSSAGVTLKVKATSVDRQ